MAETPGKYDLNAKWDACLDLGVRRFVYTSFAGASAGLLLFRSPVTRWASVAFGAGVGIGSAYSECSQKFYGSSPILTPSVSQMSSAGLVNDSGVLTHEIRLTVLIFNSRATNRSRDAEQ